MLGQYRILDLTDERGLLAGQILADLGADVIQVEPPAGSSVRRREPLLGDNQDLESSLYWCAYARNKRGVTCDLDQDAGRELFERLLGTADVLIESSAPGAMRARGLDYESLAERYPRLVYVSISPFGQAGPKADYAATDLIVMAAGGSLLAAGDPDRAPVRVSEPQAFLHAAAEAAAACQIALWERRRSEVGQHVDVSAQQAVALATNSTILSVPFGDRETVRASGGFMITGYGPAGSLHLRLIWPAKDGHISLGLFFGSAIGPFTERLMEWIYQEGGCDRATRDKDWIGYGQLLATGEEPLEEFERVKSVVAAFTSTKTKAELLDAALENRLMIAPVADERDVLESEQLARRQFWTEVPHSAVATSLKFPGPPARFSRRPPTSERAAPTLGQHNEEIYTGELNIDTTDLQRLRNAGVV